MLPSNAQRTQTWNSNANWENTSVLFENCPTARSVLWFPLKFKCHDSATIAISAWYTIISGCSSTMIDHCKKVTSLLWEILPTSGVDKLSTWKKQWWFPHWCWVFSFYCKVRKLIILKFSLVIKWSYILRFCLLKFWDTFDIKVEVICLPFMNWSNQFVSWINDAKILKWFRPLCNLLQFLQSLEKNWHWCCAICPRLLLKCIVSWSPENVISFSGWYSF